jgi:hypothetical protein
MQDEYSEMLAKLNEIVNELRDHNHTCENEQCCVKSLLNEIDFENG